MRKTLTDRSIAALKPKPKRFAVADPALASHYVRVAPTGAKSFVCVAIDPRDGRQVWATLGTADVMKIADARERARTAIRRIKDGLDPFETPPPRARTFDSVAEDWLKRHVRANGLRSEPQLAARQMAAKSATFKEAPPISPPSMSGWPNSATALSALTLPP